MDPRIEEVKLFTMSGTVFISDVFPIDTRDSFKVQFKARSLNPNWLSRGYFFIDCLNEEMMSIRVQDVYVMTDKPPVTVIGISSDRKNIMIDQDYADWGDMREKYLGVYLNGDTDRLPVLGTAQRQLERKDNFSIELVICLGWDVAIQNGITKARLHGSAGTFMYPAMSSEIIPADRWATYEAWGITGEAWGVNRTIFRPETKFIHLGFLPNYRQQDEDAEMMIKDFEFTRSLVNF